MSPALPAPTVPPVALPDWRELCHLSNEELGQYDIAVVNLACSVGLPGAEVIDVPGCLKAIDDWAVGIRRITEVGLKKEFRPYKEKFDYSEPLYRMVKLVHTLQDHCGISFDHAKIGARPEDPFDLHEHFIYGPIQGPGGTCATLPVLYAAVGRRLGYPVRLVSVPRHMFCRWDDPATGQRVNIEATGHGVNVHPDDYYRRWPVWFSPGVEAANGYLRSMTPREELADFIGRRGIHWREIGEFRRAADAFVVSGRFDLDQPEWFDALLKVEIEWERSLAYRRPPGFPHLEVVFDAVPRRRWPEVVWSTESRLRYLEATENVLKDAELEARWWAPLREGRSPQGPIPSKIAVDCTGEALCTIRP